jgi:predicted nucleic acid-binding protein
MSFETNCFLSDLVKSQGGKGKMSKKWNNQDLGTSISQVFGILSCE